MFVIRTSRFTSAVILGLLVLASNAHAQELSNPTPVPDSKLTPAPQLKPEPKIELKPEAKSPAKPSVRVVQPREFCERLTNAMTSLGSQVGSDRRAAMRIGGKASAAVISQLKSGTMMPYLDAQTFKASPAPEADRKWFSLSEVLVSSLGGMPKNVLLISDLNDLKLTPQVMPGSQLLVLAKNLGDMSPDRAKTLAMTAQALGVEINIIWVNKNRDAQNSRAAQGLAFMATLTGGAFLDLSLEGTCGQT
jgi:hypothetical protein